MEEKTAKEVKLKTAKTEEKKQQPLTYEQLNKICGELYQENQKLIQQLRQANLASMFKRLDYLFMVLKFEAVIKDAEFINNCVAEIKEAMTPREEDPQEESK